MATILVAIQKTAPSYHLDAARRDRTLSQLVLCYAPKPFPA
jgi:hypothetical protein